MRIVNAHTHLFEVRGKDEIPTNVSVLRGMDKSIPLLKAEELLRQMDEAHIDVSVLFAVVAPIVHGSNEYVASI